jgi:membrane associated rhomboid family serine protease
MIPIGDDKLKNVPRPFMTWILIVINIAIYLYEFSLTPEMLNELAYRFGAIPDDIMQGHHLSGLVTSMFLHGGWLHLIGNMLFLYVFGDNIEAALGHAGFLLYYLSGGIIAAAAHAYVNSQSIVPMVGASGAISACLGSYIIMYPRSKVRSVIPLGIFFPIVRVSAWIFLGVWIIIQLISGTIQSGSLQVNVNESGTAYWAHIGGFTYGLILGFLFYRRASRIEVIRED